MGMTTDKEYADRVRQLTSLLEKAANNCRDRNMIVTYAVNKDVHGNDIITANVVKNV